MIVPEEVDRERATKRQLKIAMSDEPGSYDNDELRLLLTNYLAEKRKTPRRIREILLPLCLTNEIVSRDMIKKELITREEATDEGQAGIMVTSISHEIGFESRDYLRQIISFERPNPWEKENYRLLQEYRPIVEQILTGYDQ